MVGIGICVFVSIVWVLNVVLIILADIIHDFLSVRLGHVCPPQEFGLLTDLVLSCFIDFSKVSHLLHKLKPVTSQFTG